MIPLYAAVYNLSKSTVHWTSYAIACHIIAFLHQFIWMRSDMSLPLKSSALIVMYLPYSSDIECSNVT